MTTGDIPSIASSAYTTTAYNLTDCGLGAGTTTAGDFLTSTCLGFGGWPEEAAVSAIRERRFQRPKIPHTLTYKDQTPMSDLRLVQVFVADADENVPLDNRLLYTGAQKLTDLTDQELFFEIEMKSLLDKHNEYRKTLVNKDVKERTEYLEPVRIRDLKMVVVNVAKF